jgi:hypothetical protein
MQQKPADTCNAACKSSNGHLRCADVQYANKQGQPAVFIGGGSCNAPPLSRALTTRLHARNHTRACQLARCTMTVTYCTAKHCTMLVKMAVPQRHCPALSTRLTCPLKRQHVPGHQLCRKAVEGSSHGCTALQTHMPGCMHAGRMSPVLNPCETTTVHAEVYLGAAADVNRHTQATSHQQQCTTRECPTAEIATHCWYCLLASGFGKNTPAALHTPRVLRC